MGFIISKILDFFNRSRNNFKIIILGIQNAGKTTILYRLSLGQLIKTTPTIGSNVEEITYNNVKFQAWDLGGQESTRSVWDVYFINADAIIYVIDSHDENYEESKNQFYKLLVNETLKDAVILIFANKQDLPGSKNINEIINIYNLTEIKNHIWHIQPCSAQTGEGLITGIKWLSDQLVYKTSNSFPINPYVSENENNISNIDSKNNVNESNVAFNINNSTNNTVNEINEKKIEENKNNIENKNDSEKKVEESK